MADLHMEEIKKGSRQTVRVRLLQFAGGIRVDIRVHELGEPLHHGPNFQPHRLPELIAALQRVEKTACKAGLLARTAEAA